MKIKLLFIFSFFFVSQTIRAQIVTIETTLASPCAALKIEPLHIDNINVYPNPSTGKFNLDFIFLKSNSSIKIYDVKGSLVFKREEIKEKEIINLEKLKNGFYFLVYKDQEKSYSKKLIIQK